MTTPATQRADRWRRYLADLEAHAAVPQSLASEGMLVRVTGLVLEAAGVRAPVGSVCEVSASSGAPVPAEGVGFHGDRA
jgi:flagellum-specific ATP synthase